MFFAVFRRGDFLVDGAFLRTTFFSDFLTIEMTFLIRGQPDTRVRPAPVVYETVHPPA